MASVSNEFESVNHLRNQSNFSPDSPKSANNPVVAPTEDLASSQSKVRRVDPKVLRANRIVAPFPSIKDSSIFRILRAQVLKRMKARNARSLGVSSTFGDEGKTLIAINLAMSISQVVDHPVLLVELDLRRPSLLNYFGLSVDKGIDDVLTEEARVEDCLINLGQEELVILPARRPTLLSSEYLSSPRMGSLAAELRDRYPKRLILYDLPPMLLSDDCLVVENYIDACLFVVEEGKAGKSELERALSLIDKDILIGTVLNKASKVIQKQYGYY